MILGAPISLSQFLLWNLLPVTVGNIVAGAFFTGAALYLTYSNPATQALRIAPASDAALSEQPAFAPTATLNPM